MKQLSRHQLERLNINKCDVIYCCYSIGSIIGRPKRLIAKLVAHSAKRSMIVILFLALTLLILVVFSVEQYDTNSDEVERDHPEANQQVINKQQPLQLDSSSLDGDSRPSNSNKSLSIQMMSLQNVSYAGDKVKVMPDDHHVCSSNVTGVHFTCANIHHIKLKHMVGRGVSKQVYLGTYCGRRVAVKMVSRHVLDVKRCLQRLSGCVTSSADSGHVTSDIHPSVTAALCYATPAMKLMKVKEIMLLQQLHHPSLLSLLGYCARSEEMSSLSLKDHGLVAVYEYGQPFYMSTLQRLPLTERLSVALDLLDLVHYLQTSQLGSLLIGDFKREHFLLVDGRIKLTDLDDVTAADVTNPRCVNSSRGSCRCGDTEVSTAICQGQSHGDINAHVNLLNLKRHLLSPLFTPKPSVSSHYEELGKTSVTGSTVDLVTEQTIRTVLQQHFNSAKELKDQLRSFIP